MALLILVGVIGALSALVYAFLRYQERQGSLVLPAPSFKAVTRKIEPINRGEEEGVFAPNNYLHKAKVLFRGHVLGSESVAVSPDGTLYMLDKFGNVLRASGGSTSKPEFITHLGPGRPLGFHFNAKGDLFICNAGTGLQVVEKDTGKVVLLSSLAPVSPGSPKTTPVHYANDLTIASDGGIYFTDSTDIPPALNAAGFYDTMASYLLTMIQGDHTGRLLHYSSQGKTTCIADKIWYSNGVELDKDESSALVVETCLSRVIRIWLKGPKAGSREVFLDKLPGYPDGLTRGVDGSFWISLVTMKQPGLENLMKTRVTRWLLPRIPQKLKKVTKGTAVLQVSQEGKILRYMGDPAGTVVSTISAVTEVEKGLYIGNLGGDHVSFLAKADYSPVLR